MTIRRKLLLFIPMLVLSVNLITFFLFESGKIVQHSYNQMMDRILLYNQSARKAEDNLRKLHAYLLDPGDAARLEAEREQAGLQELRQSLAEQKKSSPHAAELESYENMLHTFMEQEQNAMAASGAHLQRDALSRYEDAEKTAGFIREEGQRIVDLELSSYQPVYKQILLETNRMNRLGAALFGINTLMSVVFAFWISRSITKPVTRLVGMAREIAKGNLEIDPSPVSSGDELGILSGAFKQMQTDLKDKIEKDKELLEKDKLLKELELQMLQSQINPHFLFNTLNVLSKLALLEGAEKTSDLIVSVSNMLRYSLRKLDQPVTLLDEVEHVKEYFAIQQARFRDRVRFETEIDDTALKEPIPSLTIQPLVENAFIHGIAGMEAGAVIRLKIRREGSCVRISVWDNGAGMSEEVRQALLKPDEGGKTAAAYSDSTGLGTRNVFKRLQLFYGRADLVEIESRPGNGTTITLKLPIKEGTEPCTA